MKFLYILVLLLIWPAIAHVHAQEPLLRHYTAKDGLSSNTVYNAYQDSRGFIWFCTSQGVCRFDGHQFKTYTTKDGLPDNEIFGVKEDAQGRLWLAGYNARACYIYNEKIYNAQNDRYCSLIENDKLLQRLQKDAGRMDPLKLFKGIADVAVKLYAYALYDASDVVYLYSDGNIHYFNYHGHILATGKDKIARLPFNGALTCYYYQGYIYATSAGKLCKLKVNGTSLNIAGIIDLPCRINNYEAVNDSTILLASDNGIIPLSVNRFAIDTAGSMIDNISTSSVLRDRSGNCWITSFSDGIYLLPATQPSIFQQGVKLPEASIEAIHITRGNKIVAGYSNGMARILDGKSIRAMRLPGFTKRDRIMTIAAAANGRIFFGTDRGLYAIDTNSWTAVKLLRSALTRSSIKAVVPYGDSILVGCTHGSGLVDRDGAALIEFLITRTTALAVDSATYWIGTLNGVYTYTGDTLQRFDVHETLSGSRITAITKACNGDIVFATHQNGIFVWDRNNLVQLNEKNGLSSNLCRKMLIDKACNIWVATNSGLDILSVHAGSFAVRPFPLSDGIPGNEIQDFAVKDNMLYIACPEGIVMLDINKQTLNTPVKSLITSVAFRDTAIAGTDRITLSYDRNDLTINYTAIALGDGDNLSYKYVLEGGGGDTIFTKLSSVNLNAIASGDYRFLVWARSNNGRWSDAPASLLLEIEPPFWETSWFISASALFVVSVVYTVLRIRIKRIKQIEENKTLLNKKMAELEMQALRAQINPHFIFNALNSIQNYYNQNDERNANRYMTTFAKLIRKTLTHSRENWLSLAEEAEMIMDYIHLEQMRFKNAFDYELKMAGDINAGELKVPAMLIQPYVENAINHGLRHLQDEKGYLLIDFALADCCLVCTVNDNGVGFAKASNIEKKTKQYTSLGMEITKGRIETINQLYNVHIDVRIADRYELDNTTHGTIVIIRIPLTNQYSSHE